MKKKIIAVMAAVMVSVSMSQGMVLRAEGTDTTANSSIMINLVADTDTPNEIIDPDDGETPFFPPVDPSNPDGDNETDGGETNAKGPLVIDYITPFDFGDEIKITNKKTVYTSSTPKAHIQVTDIRGEADGWKVTGEFSGFQNGVTEEKALDGSFITFKGQSAFQKDASLAATPWINSEAKLVEGEVVPMMKAQVGQGKGSWIGKWYTDTKNEVQLTIPANSATEGIYTATIEWNISSEVQ